MHYTYVLTDPCNKIPFYVGKGQGNRLFSERSRNRHCYSKIQKIKSLGLNIIYEKWFESEDKDFCYWMEIYLIAEFKELNYKLCNYTLGGEDPPSWKGVKRKSFSEKHLQKLSLSHMGQPSYRKGKKHNEESKEKIRIARAKQVRTLESYKKGWETRRKNGHPPPRLGKKHTEESKTKLRETCANKRL